MIILKLIKGKVMKQFTTGAICMALICSVAFNFYQAQKLEGCTIIPSMETIYLGDE